MKKKHPFLYNIIRRSIVVVLLAMMALTAYNQSTGSLISPEGLLAKIITPIQGFVSQASQAISNYMYRVKLRSAKRRINLTQYSIRRTGTGKYAVACVAWRI